jgi:hypothetical protein
MNFREFFEMSSLRDILGNVPQRPDYHAEGPVFTHTRMVRQNIDRAIEVLKKASQDESSAFSRLDMDLTDQEYNLLRVIAWLHDIGKASATTVGGEKWQGQDLTDDEMLTLRAKAHEKPQHYEPMMDKLGDPWKKMYKKAGTKDLADIEFVIKQHMALRQGGFGRRLANIIVDSTGKYLPLRKVKLLLIFILADWSGRFGDKGEANPWAAIEYMQKSADQRVNRYRRSLQQAEKLPDDEEGFVQALKDAGKSDDIIAMAYRGKFGKEYNGL